MNITYIVNVFPKISETFVLDQITYLIDQGHDVNIIAAEDRQEPIIHQAVSDYKLLAKTIYPVCVSDVSGIKITAELINTILFTDIFHAHFANWPANTARELSKITGIPFIFTAHAYDIFNTPDVDKLKQVSEAANKIITISQYNINYLCDLLGEEFREKFNIIRCPVAPQPTQADRQDNKNPVTLLCGRFVEKKGVQYAIKALSMLSKKYNAELVIIGDGPLLDEIKVLISELNLGHSIKLLGELSHSDVLAQMKSADIFLLPSVTVENGDREGLPVSILEAQAAGLPVVSTHHSGIPEGVIDNETGFLVPERDENAIAEKLTLLIEDKELRKQMGAKGQKHVGNNFNRNEEFSKLEEILGTYCNGGNSTSKTTPDQTILKVRLKALLKLQSSQNCNTIQQTSNQQQTQVDKEAIVTKKSKRITELESSEQDLKQQLKELSREVSHLRNTLSWKITTPLRKIGKLLK